MSGLGLQPRLPHAEIDLERGIQGVGADHRVADDRRGLAHLGRSRAGPIRNLWTGWCASALSTVFRGQRKRVALQKLFEEGHDPLGGILDNVVARVGQTMHLGSWK